ncbi:MAG: hypothetical protein ACLRPU_21175, partial [Enterococcus hulanensis]
KQKNPNQFTGKDIGVRGLWMNQLAASSLRRKPFFKRRKMNLFSYAYYFSNLLKQEEKLTKRDHTLKA